MSTQKLLIFADRYDWKDLEDIAHPNVEVTLVPEGERSQLLSMIGNFDAYIASLRIVVDAEVLAAAPKLKVVGTCSTGTDHLHLLELQQRGITMISLKNERE